MEHVFAADLPHLHGELGATTAVKRIPLAVARQKPLITILQAFHGRLRTPGMLVLGVCAN